MFGGFLVDALGDHSGLCSEEQVIGGDLENVVHVDGAQDDRATNGDAAAAEAGAGASGDDGYSEVGCPAEDISDLLGRAGKHDGFGRAMERGSAVEAVGVKVLGGGEDVVFRQECDERFEAFGREGHERTGWWEATDDARWVDAENGSMR